jgi:hypothetical protein
MRFNREANVRFHFVCASVSKPLLLEVRQRCREIFAAHAHHGEKRLLYAQRQGIQKLSSPNGAV